MRFVYSVVRFVPDPARGEFVNVGAIVGSEESSEWQWRQVENPVRARLIDERQALDAVWSFLDRIGRVMDDYEHATETLFDPQVELSEEWLHDLYVEHRNVVQLGPPTPMIASSADEALDRVFDQLVVDPSRRKHPFLKKHAALAAVRSAYRQHSVTRSSHLRERTTLQTRHHRERFDFAVTNGKTLQLTHTWSFQVPDQELLSEQVKAWGWTVRDVQSGGGRLKISGGAEFEVPKNVDVEVVYVPPISEKDAPAIHDAFAVFKTLGIGHFPLNQAPAVALRAHALLVDAGVGRLDLPPESPSSPEVG